MTIAVIRDQNNDIIVGNLCVFGTPKKIQMCSLLNNVQKSDNFKLYPMNENNQITPSLLLKLKANATFTISGQTYKVSEYCNINDVDQTLDLSLNNYPNLPQFTSIEVCVTGMHFDFDRPEV